MKTEPKTQQAINNAHQALIANVEAANFAVKRKAPRETLVYHIDLMNKALKSLKTLAHEVDLAFFLQGQAD